MREFEFLKRFEAGPWDRSNGWSIAWCQRVDWAYRVDLTASETERISQKLRDRDFLRKTFERVYGHRLVVDFPFQDEVRNKCDLI
ncbi:hypothetical protein X744_22545 [Mesorhizobium sp. LNJC372A00]|nr:hypothetical protein X745_20830 [Mesorhizobium sp. LNJC374B00]ESY56004.1 hypothetical protein X744_22545 [Mesorhizobium sp. LNJC372A00]